ncbi:MAG TPA: amidohydrolase family protein [Pyrinomonadaceae bacterium]|nr:amidohydrolase family protein [Pyrinomonadaceae bacterium]
MAAKIYLARWLMPVSSPAVEGGALAVEGTRIVGMGARDELLARFPEATQEEFGEAAIMPGLVNCHSHLELTAMRGYLEDVEDFFLAWLRKLTVARNERMTADDLRVSAAWGAVEALRAGVTCVGDAGDSSATTAEALREVGLRGVVFQEAFGPDPSAAAEQAAKLKGKVSRLRSAETGLVGVGLSPHAPYTVSGPLFELLAEYAQAEKLPMMIHAAESPAERLFMLEGDGPFAEMLRWRGIEWRAPKVSTIQYLKSLDVLAARPLLAHCVHADDADIGEILDAGASVAHCPKSNAKLGHGRAPLAAMLRAGLCVGLGSDSVAANNNCDLLEEARFAALASRAAGDRLKDGRMVSAEDVLRAATLGGARALGLGQRVGALAEGLEADFAVVGLGGAHQRPVYEPASALAFSSSGCDVLLTVVAGRELFRDGRVTSVDEDRLRARMSEIRGKLAEV